MSQMAPRGDQSRALPPLAANECPWPDIRDRLITLIVPFGPAAPQRFGSPGSGEQARRHSRPRRSPFENRPRRERSPEDSGRRAAKADGYTLLLVSAAHTINPTPQEYSLRRIAGFHAVSQLTRTAYVLVTSQASKFEKIGDRCGGRHGAERADHVRVLRSSERAPSRGAALRRLSGAEGRACGPTRGGAPALIGVLRGRRRHVFSSLAARAPSSNRNRCAPWECPAVGGSRCCPSVADRFGAGHPRFCDRRLVRRRRPCQPAARM